MSRQKRRTEQAIRWDQEKAEQDKRSFPFSDMRSEPVGFAGGSRRTYTGALQELKRVDSMETVKIVELSGGTDVDVGSLVALNDKRVYERKGGLLECWVPAEVQGESSVYFAGIDWKRVPSRNELAYLFDAFFAKYKREVLMLMGERINPTKQGGKWVYFVPPQVGTGGSVKWSTSSEEVAEFHSVARWIGTIHVHPGKSYSPSGTDVDEWADPLSAGVHLIFGRSGGFGVFGAMGGKTFPLASGSIVGTKRTPVE